MENYISYVYVILAYALLTAGWMGVQLIAKKMGTKNHIDHEGNCCGACDRKDSCSKKDKAEINS
ncbi:MAG: hypothetical protein IPN29_17265 [Saprospiraceae bacterium]|nr:hypothetical protein [Saprospiraceae bacterium]